MKKENFMDNRPGWDEYFMEMAVLTARRSTCLRRHVGAVIVQEKHIVATGYNGAPRGLDHCGDREGGCLRQQLGIPSGQKHELCRALHAEQNAIIQAATLGQSIDDLYHPPALHHLCEDDHKCRDQKNRSKGRLS